MKTRLTLIKQAALLALLSALICQPSNSLAQGTAFTYQGRLNSGASPASGTYDFRFRLSSDPLGNTYEGGALLTNGVPVANGLFTVTLDFGANFPGADRWLEIGVRTNGGGGYATLSPLQALTPTPYAILAASANNFSGVIPSGGLSGNYTSAVSFNNASNAFSGTFTGGGAGLTNVNAATLGGLTRSNLWQTAGNSNTVAGVNFLGTADNQPVEIRVNNQRALRFEYTTNTPNMIGGWSNNYAAPGVVMATIGGGGGLSITLGTLNTNSVWSSYGTVGGGLGNQAGSTNGDPSLVRGATVGGGANNTAGAHYSTIAGGTQNTIMLASDFSSIGGGYVNTVEAPNCTVGGGVYNRTGTNTYFATISGGGYHNIGTNSSSTTISGGYANGISDNTLDGAIGGGSYNVIGTNSYYATIGGGRENAIGANATSATVSGGTKNLASGFFATVPGGAANLAAGQYSFAAGWSAQANHSGTFVWADASDGLGFGSTASNQFNVRANSGVRFVTGGAGMTLDGPAQATSFQGSGSGLTGLNAANIVSGTLSDVRLSGNVALLNAGTNTFAGDIAMEGGAAYHRLQLSGGNALGYLYGSYPGLGDGIHMGYNYYYDAGGNGHISNSGGGTSRISVQYGQITLAVGGINIAPGTDRLVATTAGVTVYGTFNNLSDRNAKQQFEPVTPSRILEKVARLPITEWSYKEDAATRHIGPVAQDFYSTFNIGTDDKHIAPIDQGGVALAAIQGLNEKVETRSQRAEVSIRILEAENEDLKARLAKLEQLVDHKLNGAGQ